MADNTDKLIGPARIQIIDELLFLSAG